MRSAPQGSGFAEGDRVAGMSLAHGFADLAVVPSTMAVRLSEKLDFAEGAGLVLNYHTAWFSLVHRGGLRADVLDSGLVRVGDDIVT